MGHSPCLPAIKETARWLVRRLPRDASFIALDGNPLLSVGAWDAIPLRVRHGAPV